MLTQDNEQNVQAQVEAFRKRERKDKLDTAIQLSLELQVEAAETHDALPVHARARRRAAEAYLIARGTLAVVALKWSYKFADDETRIFVRTSALLWEFQERILQCETRDQASVLVQQILGNVRLILDEPAMKTERQDTAA